VQGSVLKPARLTCLLVTANVARRSNLPCGHKISPQVEHFPMSQVNDALAHLEARKARYRIVLDADFPR